MNFSFVGELPAWMVEDLARQAEAKADLERRISARRDVPASRKPPRHGAPMHAPDGVIPFPLAAGGDLAFGLAGVAVHATGIAFDLVVSAESGRGERILEQVNVSHKAMAKKAGRVFLGIVLPDGEVVTNKASAVRDAPDDDDAATPWLHGGAAFHRRGQVGAHYFLSPRPRAGDAVAITVSYRELGIDTALTVTVDSATFARISPPKNS